MGAMGSQITSLAVVYSIVYSDADQRKHQSSASLDFVRGIHRGPVNSPHKGQVTRKMFPFDDVIMWYFPGMYSVEQGDDGYGVTIRFHNKDYYTKFTQVMQAKYPKVAWKPNKVKGVSIPFHLKIQSGKWRLFCLGGDKMATIWGEYTFRCIFLDTNCCILIRITMKLVLKVPIDNRLTSVQIMACTEQATHHFLNWWWPG